MPFTPNVTPGRFDNLGAMIVPRDIFEHVTQTVGWVNNIDTHTPSTRRKYLESIKYWMDLNGACVIRNASTGRFATIKDITVCATILPGNVLKAPVELPEPPTGFVVEFIVNTASNVSVLVTNYGDASAMAVDFGAGPEIHTLEGPTTQVDYEYDDNTTPYDLYEITVKPMEGSGGDAIETGEVFTFEFNFENSPG